MSGADNSRKTALVYSLNEVALQRASDVLQMMGKALPCRVIKLTGQIATVAFELQNMPFSLPQVDIPIATSKYDWTPLQAGDKGLAVPSDVYLGGVSGLGGGTADYPRRANLATLQFVPTANKDWQPPGGDPNMRVVQGPSGVLVQSLDGKTSVKITKTDVTITVQSGHKVTVTAGGTPAKVSTVNGPSTVLYADA